MAQLQSKTSTIGVHPFRTTLFAAVLMWFSFPPFGLWYLGWIALFPLGFLVDSDELPGRRPFLKIWVAGLFYWLATFYFVPIPHPALWAGWLVLSAYLACYFPLFIAAGRTMNRVFKIPVFLSLAIGWTGIELIRCYLFTGMGLVCLSHSQYQLPVVIQLADISGAYGVTFVLACVSGCVYQVFKVAALQRRLDWLHLLACGCLVGGILFYGNLKLNEEIEFGDEHLKIALIQGSVDATLPKTEEEIINFRTTLIEEYFGLTRQALQQHPDVELLIWPEGSWPQPDLHPDTNTSKILPEQLAIMRDNQDYYWSQILGASTAFPELLTGSVSVDPVAEKQFGAALRIDSSGQIKERYFKNHLVMIGEYVPLAEYIPLLQRLPAVGTGLQAGSDSITMEFNGIKIAPNICFESTVPHYMRRQINLLEDRGEEPHAMANLTNDGWFFGTSCLDFHLACNVFRAVELRKPNIVCANTGFSAEIDDRGIIKQQGPRRSSQVILIDFQQRPTESVYRRIGDVIPISLALLTLIAFLTGTVQQFLSQRRSGSSKNPTG